MNESAIANVTMVQRRRCYGSVSMNESAIANVTMVQRRRGYIGIPMDVFDNINTLMVQRRRCCSFDSPGLARNEPTLGKHPQGDSTPSVLSFFWGSIVRTRGLIGCYANIPMNISPIVDVATTQRYKFCANIPMNIFCNINALMVQRRRCCSFDSPGLARNEPTLGKCS